MSTYTKILYHIVFSTKYRKNSLASDRHEELYRYICGIVRNKKSHLSAINGTENHLHILTEIHPTLCLSELVKTIKVSSSFWIKDSKAFPFFEGWQDGYSAFTCSSRDRERIVRYVQNQKEHHKKRSFEEELRALLDKAGIAYDERYIFV